MVFFSSSSMLHAPSFPESATDVNIASWALENSSSQIHINLQITRHNVPPLALAINFKSFVDPLFLWHPKFQIVEVIYLFIFLDFLWKTHWKRFNTFSFFWWGSEGPLFFFKMRRVVLSLSYASFGREDAAHTAKSDQSPLFFLKAKENTQKLI